jgi:hypothetical protein
MPTKEELQKAHDDGQRGVNRPIRDFIAEHVSTKRDHELQQSWNEGAKNAEAQRKK